MAKKKEEKKINDLQDYSQRVIHNEDSFRAVMKNFRPDIYVLMDILDTTGINSYVVFHIIKHLNNIVLGTGHGNVTITVKDGIVTYIAGEETTKLDEKLRKI